MKRLVTILSIVATSVLLSAATVMSAESATGSEGGKDECLLVSMNCAGEVDSINQRIERLNKEIAKGADVYTQDELRKLNIKLDETLKQLEVLTLGG